MSSRQARIWLLVEDDENDFVLMRRALQRANPNATLQWVTDGIEAKHYLQGQNRYCDRQAFPLPELVLSDLKMPRCSGLELVQWVRSQRQFRTLPFIMFSSSDQPGDVGSAYYDGANWYLAKPSSFDGLVEMLSRLEQNLSVAVWNLEPPA